MFRYTIIALALLFAASAEAQEKYSKQIQDSIEVLKDVYHSVFKTERLFVYNDTLLIVPENNGCAGDYTKIPILNAGCRFEDQKILFTCNSVDGTIPKCIVREIKNTGSRGSDFKFLDSKTISFMPGESAVPLDRLAGLMIYVVNAVQKY